MFMKSGTQQKNIAQCSVLRHVRLLLPFKSWGEGQKAMLDKQLTSIQSLKFNSLGSQH